MAGSPPPSDLFHDSPGAPADLFHDTAEAPGVGESLLRGAAQGASLGFADELTGGGEALLDKLRGAHEALGELYVKHRDESRRNYAAAQEENPIAYGAGQVGGGLATAAIPGLGAGGVLAQAGKMAALGVASGVGGSEAENAEGLIKDAAVSGFVGGAAGGAGALLGKGLGALANKAVTPIQSKADELAVKAAYGTTKGVEDVGAEAAMLKEGGYVTPFTTPAKAAARAEATAGEASKAGVEAVKAGDTVAAEMGPRTVQFPGGPVEAPNAYHGSPKQDLTAISANPPGRQYDNATSQLGAFFAPTEKDAGRYAGESGRVYGARVDLKKPYDMPYREFDYFQSPHKGPGGESLDASLWGGRAEELKQEAAAFRAKLASAGHDGVIVSNSRGPMEIASFADVPLTSGGGSVQIEGSGITGNTMAQHLEDTVLTPLRTNPARTGAQEKAVGDSIRNLKQLGDAPISFDKADQIARDFQKNVNWNDPAASVKKDVAYQLKQHLTDQLGAVDPDLATLRQLSGQKASEAYQVADAANAGVKDAGPKWQIPYSATHLAGMVLKNTVGQYKNSLFSAGLDKLAAAASTNPATLGKWGAYLASAAARGPAALATTHYSLAQTDPDYAARARAAMDAKDQ